MKRVYLAAALPVALCGCASFDLAAYAEAANQLDPGCYKNVHLDVRPLLLPGWVVPVVSGTYDKTCNPDQGTASAATRMASP